jgi:prophage DNA circulation protein
MKKALVLCALVGVAVYATTAWSASTADPTEQRLVKDVAALKKQTSTLQKQVTTLQKQVKTLNTNTAEAVLALAALGICSSEVTADAFQGTWNIVDQISAALQAGKTYFGPQTPVTATLQGQDWCAVIGVTRSQVVPPTVAPYLALLAPFHSFSDRFGLSALAAFGRTAHLR